MEQKKSGLAIMLSGIIKENPVLVLILGTCPTLAISTMALNGVGMGLAATFVLVCSNMVISALKNIIPEKVRIPCYIVVIAGFVTIVRLIVQAYFQAIDKALGIYLPLIVVNCIILARAEAFASKHGPLYSVMDGLGMGLGFTLAITLIACIREILGNGTIFGANIMGTAYEPAILVILPPGGFITLGSLLGLLNKVTAKTAKKEA